MHFTLSPSIAFLTKRNCLYLIFQGKHNEKDFGVLTTQNPSSSRQFNLLSCSLPLAPVPLFLSPVR